MPVPACASRSRPPITARTLAPIGVVLLAAGELGRAELVGELAVELDRRALALAAGGLVGLLGARALLQHARVEAVDVDGAAALLRDLAREVDREPERVVEEERVVAGDVALATTPSSSSRPRASVWRKRSSSRLTTPSTRSCCFAISG